MSAIENIVAPVKNFAVRHKTALTIAVTATVTAVTIGAINRKSNEQIAEFLKEHDLYDEYFNAGEPTQIEA